MIRAVGFCTARFVPARHRQMLAAVAMFFAAACGTGPSSGVVAESSTESEPLRAEAGFIEVPPQLHGEPNTARLFYSFRPADSSPEQKPLLVFYDGGPGSPTSANLTVFGTGPMTIDPDTGVVKPNPNSFTSFANLLYIDERQAGFSYSVGARNVTDPICTYSVVDDALDFVRVIAAFLANHASLASAKVVLVGESYGGTRTTAILHLAQSQADGWAGLPSDVRDFFGRHATQFGTAVLIEPLVAGAIQFQAQALLEADVPDLVSPDVTDLTRSSNADQPCFTGYDVEETCTWENDLVHFAAAALASPTTSTALLGVDLGGISALLPAARRDAFRPAWVGGDPRESAFVARFGALERADRYWSPEDPACQNYEPYDDVESSTWLVPVLTRSKLFITNARYDAVIYSPAIPYLLEHNAGLPTTVDMTPRSGEARPGWIHTILTTDAGANTVDIRFPSYNRSGHQVAMTQGADLAADVAEWLAGLP